MKITVITSFGERKEAKLYTPEALGAISELRFWRFLAKCLF
jgi:hypothetical protein